MPEDRPDALVKVIEVVASSTQSFSDAVRNAVRTASRTLRNIVGVDVLTSSAEVRDGEITVYKVNCKLAFLVEAASGSGEDELTELVREAPAEPPYVESGPDH
jgi:flavin-binding protein dodecin